MQFDYFYGQQADQYSFYRIPKLLITSDLFWNISADAKLLYGILLDRMNLSAKNGWLDEKGRVYIIYTLEETMAALNCGNQKATKLFNELEKKCGLIERKRQGLGKPNLIYVKNFITGIETSVESHFLNHENHDSGNVKSTIPDSRKSHGNNTDNNYTEFSDTDPIPSSVFSGTESEGMILRKRSIQIANSCNLAITETGRIKFREMLHVITNGITLSKEGFQRFRAMEREHISGTISLIVIIRKTS